MEIILQVLLLAAGFALLIKGADFFVDGAAGLAAKFGIPQLVIGLTIVAFGTSAPETAVSLAAAIKGSAEITIGNVVGSNIINILVILGVASLIVPLHVKKSTACFEMPFVIVASVVLALLGLFDHIVGKADGVILLAGMAIFLIYLIILSKKGQGDEPDEPIKAKLPILLLMIVGGLVLIVFGSDVTVDAATRIAEIFGVDDRIIGLTIVALGTSLPELVTSVTAGLKGNADIAVGNIVGSNIFNILFVVGVTALITPVAYAPGFFIDSMVCIASAALLWILAFRKRTLTRTSGIIMLICYGGYLAYLISSNGA